MKLQDVVNTIAEIALREQSESPIRQLVRSIIIREMKLGVAGRGHFDFSKENDDDDEDIQVSVNEIKKALPGVKQHDFQNMGHFTYEQMKTDKFPELLEIIES